jgi:Fic-DOC domain mobile mystery protein B
MPDPMVPVGDGHTSLAEEDRRGLIPSYISTRRELFEAEERNISKALLRRPPTVDQVLDDAYLRSLHHDMFGDVWDWAGHYRTRDTNIGVPFERIPGAVRALVLDARTWVEYETYPPDELAVRFHHRLVAIHPFPNGNGRHGRIATDYLIEGLGGEVFTWGAHSDKSIDELRRIYLAALYSADTGDEDGLLAFARS